MRICVLIAALLLLPMPAFAQSDEDDEALAELLEVLEEETDLATRTRQNRDFVPGLVTVLQGDYLQALGARTVWDALAWVPGVETTLDDRGTPTVTVRGIPFPFNTGGVQILLNAVPTSREAAGANSTVLLIPIAQVQRIEFIRGPGSVIYGDNAFQGLLNVVTRRDQPQVQVEVDDAGNAIVQARRNAQFGDTSATLDVAAMHGDEPRLPLHNDGNERRYSAIAQIENGGLSINGSLFGRRLRSPLNVFAPTLGGDSSERSLAMEARWRHGWSDALRAELRLQYLSTDLRKPILAFVADQCEVGAELFWEGWDRQRWLIGIETTREDRDLTRVDARGSPLFPPVVTEVRDPPDRIARAVYLQDEVAVRDDLTLTAGLRWDDIDVIGDRVTPRLAAVWQAAEAHIVKLQYVEGFRGPAFFEIDRRVGDAPLDFEVNRTLEATYLYRRAESTWRLSAYRSRIDDMVFLRIPQFDFDNLAEARTSGAEIEWSRQFGTAWRIDAHLSRVHADDNRNALLQDRTITSIAEQLAHVAVLWRPDGDSSLGLAWQHVGSRGGIDGYDTVDVAWTRRDVADSGVDLRLGIDNLGNAREQHVFPGPLDDIPLPFQQRVAWVQLTVPL